MHRGLPQARAFTAKAACCSACFLLTFLPAIASGGTYSGGSGTGAEPFRISVVPDWQELMATPADWASHFVLTANLELEGIPLSPVGVAYSSPFTGVCDGNDYVIRNADVNMPGSNCVGLFGYLRTTGQIKNLGVENISVFGYVSVGGLVGDNGGDISNCYSTGSVSGTSHVGGLVGRNGNLSWPYSPSEPGRSDIYNSYSTSSVSGQDYVGGLVGTNGCVEENSETVVCWDRESCEVLYLQTLGVIRKCYSEGNVFGGSAVGGLVGKQLVGAVRDCYSTGSVTGDENVGGLVGQNGYYERYCGEACYEGECWPGCWDVWIYGDIWECYSIGRVFGGSGVGGLVGESVVLGYFNSFWDIQTSQQSSSDEGRPKTTAEMTIQTTFTDAGWDFIGETANGTEDIWAICEGTNYPRFVYQIPQGDIVCPDGVNGLDFSILARYWHETDCAALDECEGADIDLSGAVDFGDVAAVAESWLRGVE